VVGIKRKGKDIPITPKMKKPKRIVEDDEYEEEEKEHENIESDLSTSATPSRPRSGRQVKKPARLVETDDKPIPQEIGPGPKFGAEALPNENNKNGMNDEDNLDPESCKKLTVPQLRKALQRRGLGSSGRKSDLVQKLVDAVTIEKLKPIPSSSSFSSSSNSLSMPFSSSTSYPALSDSIASFPSNLFSLTSLSNGSNGQELAFTQLQLQFLNQSLLQQLNQPLLQQPLNQLLQLQPLQGAPVSQPVVSMDYNKWTMPQLQAELEKRGLDKRGRKPALIARLEQAFVKT